MGLTCIRIVVFSATSPVAVLIFAHTCYGETFVNWAGLAWCGLIIQVNFSPIFLSPYAHAAQFTNASRLRVLGIQGMSVELPGLYAGDDAKLSRQDRYTQ